MIAIFTDGACSGNPGPGGWGCVLATPDGHARELGGGTDATTNNRMEMSAVLEGLRQAVPDLPLGFHGHNDLGMATANTLAAVMLLAHGFWAGFGACGLVAAAAVGIAAVMQDAVLRKS